MIWLTVTVIVLTIIIFFLIIKIHFIHVAIDEINYGFEDTLSCETNTLITVSSGDRRIRNLATGINKELRVLREIRQKYESGDQELRDAVTNMSHDLRTPLTAICGYLDLLEQNDISEEDAKRYIAVIRNRADVLKRLTEELFRYSIIASAEEPEDFRLTSLNDVLEESIAAYYAALTAKNIVPDIILPEMKVMSVTDRGSLTRIFGNILSNVVKYSKGDLKVRLDSDGTIIFSNKAPEIDTVMAGRLFDRFFTVETGRDATGLGLSIAKILVERLGGKIYSKYESGELSIILKLKVEYKTS